MDSSRLLSIIQAASKAAYELAEERPSRELSLVITKLEEAHLWAGSIGLVNATPLPSADELLARLAGDET